MHHASQSPRRSTSAGYKDGERPVNRSLDDAVSQAFARMLSRDVSALVRSARQLSGYVRERGSRRHEHRSNGRLVGYAQDF